MPMKSSNEELVNHFGLTRLRVKGFGNLRQRLLSLDEVRENILNPIVMVNNTNVEPTKLANFTEQRASLEIKTTEINEWFQISKVIIFSKPVAKSYPQ